MPHPSLLARAGVDRVGALDRRDVHRVADHDRAALEAERFGMLERATSSEVATFFVSICVSGE